MNLIAGARRRNICRIEHDSAKEVINCAIREYGSTDPHQQGGPERIGCWRHPKRAHMIAAEECRRQALVCRELASCTGNHRLEVCLENMARTWTLLASQTDQFDARVVEVQEG